MLSGLAGSPRRQGLSLRRTERLVQLPIPTVELVTAKQPMVSMQGQPIQQRRHFSKIAPLHHMQTNAEGERLTEGAEAGFS